MDTKISLINAHILKIDLALTIQFPQTPKIIESIEKLILPYCGF